MKVRDTISMSFRRSVLFAALALIPSAHAQDKGTFHASSRNARAITGDLSFAPEKLSIGFLNFPIANIRPLAPAEIAAAFDTPAAPNSYGTLFALLIPADKKFFNKNALCGAEETRWMVTYVAGKSLQIDFFSGAKPPVLTPEAMARNTTLCGTFSYSK